MERVNLVAKHPKVVFLYILKNIRKRPTVFPGFNNIIGRHEKKHNEE